MVTQIPDTFWLWHAQLLDLIVFTLQSVTILIDLADSGHLPHLYNTFNPTREQKIIPTTGTEQGPGVSPDREKRLDISF